MLHFYFRPLRTTVSNSEKQICCWWRFYSDYRSQIKETHQAVKDSESGLEKMKIGHHIKDKGHVVEKKYNKKTGEKELNQDFQNMDECTLKHFEPSSVPLCVFMALPDVPSAAEAQSFYDEWQQEVSRFQPSPPMSCLREPPPRAAHQAALPGPEPPHRSVFRPHAACMCTAASDAVHVFFK